MAKKKVTFNFTWIIFMIIAYNVFFDDDGDKNKVEIVEQDKPAIEETVQDVKKQLIDGTEWVVDKAKEELIKIKEKEDEEKEPQPSKDEGVVMQAEKPKEEKGPDPRPLNTEPEKETTTFKQL